MAFLTKPISVDASYSEFKHWYKEYARNLVDACAGERTRLKCTPIALEPSGIIGQHSIAGTSTTEIFVTIPSEVGYSKRKPIYWITRCVENIQHECCHAIDPHMLFAKRDDANAVYASLMEFVMSVNDGLSHGKNFTDYDLTNYSHDINEIRAEFRALIRTRDFLEDAFYLHNSALAEDLILDLVEEKIFETGGHYCVCYDLNNRPDSWEDFVDIAEFSAENSRKLTISYDWTKHLDTDPLAMHLRDHVSPARRFAALHEINPRLQIFRLAVLLNELPNMHPEDTFSNLSQINLYSKNFWNPNPFFEVSRREVVRKYIERESNEITVPLEGTPYKPDNYDDFAY